MHTLAPGKDVLLYDGSCGLCRRAAGRLARSLPETTRTASFREPGALSRFPGLGTARCEAALQLVRGDGEVFAGVEAVVEALRGRWYGGLLRLYYLPGIRSAADALYRAVARRRFHPSLRGARSLPSAEELRRGGQLTSASPGRAAAPPDPARGRGPDA